MPSGSSYFADFDRTDNSIWRRYVQRRPGEPTLRTIKQYCNAGDMESGALFRRIRRGQNITSERLSVVSARRIIKKWSNAAGIKGSISGHSLRVGTAVSLAQSGATLVNMQTAG